MFKRFKSPILRLTLVRHSVNLNLHLVCCALSLPGRKLIPSLLAKCNDDRGWNFRLFNYATVIIFNPKERKCVKETWTMPRSVLVSWLGSQVFNQFTIYDPIVRSLLILPNIASCKFWLSWGKKGHLHYFRWPLLTEKSLNMISGWDSIDRMSRKC